MPLPKAHSRDLAPAQPAGASALLSPSRFSVEFPLLGDLRQAGLWEKFVEERRELAQTLEQLLLRVLRQRDSTSSESDAPEHLSARATRSAEAALVVDRFEATVWPEFLAKFRRRIERVRARTTVKVKRKGGRASASSAAATAGTKKIVAKKAGVKKEQKQDDSPSGVRGSATGAGSSGWSSSSSSLSIPSASSPSWDSSQRGVWTPYAASLCEAWFVLHISDPYPSDATKEGLAQRARVGYEQINSWFINARMRKWKKLLGRIQDGSIKPEEYSRELLAGAPMPTEVAPLSGAKKMPHAPSSSAASSASSGGTPAAATRKSTRARKTRVVIKQEETSSEEEEEEEMAESDKDEEEAEEHEETEQGAGEEQQDDEEMEQDEEEEEEEESGVVGAEQHENALPRLESMSASNSPPLRGASLSGLYSGSDYSLPPFSSLLSQTGEMRQLVTEPSAIGAVPLSDSMSLGMHPPMLQPMNMSMSMSSSVDVNAAVGAVGALRFGLPDVVVPTPPQTMRSFLHSPAHSMQMHLSLPRTGDGSPRGLGGVGVTHRVAPFSSQESSSAALSLSSSGGGSAASGVSPRVSAGAGGMPSMLSLGASGGMLFSGFHPPQGLGLNSSGGLGMSGAGLHAPSIPPLASSLTGSGSGPLGMSLGLSVPSPLTMSQAVAEMQSSVGMGHSVGMTSASFAPAAAGASAFAASNAHATPPDRAVDGVHAMPAVVLAGSGLDRTPVQARRVFLTPGTRVERP